MTIIRDESGQGAPEYGLIIAFVVVMVVAVTLAFQGAVIELIEGIRLYLDSFVP